MKNYYKERIERDPEYKANRAKYYAEYRKRKDEEHKVYMAQYMREYRKKQKAKKDALKAEINQGAGI